MPSLSPCWCRNSNPGSKSADCQVTVKQKGGGVDASIGSWGENETYEGTVN